MCFIEIFFYILKEKKKEDRKENQKKWVIFVINLLVYVLLKYIVFFRFGDYKVGIILGFFQLY